MRHENNNIGVNLISIITVTLICVFFKLTLEERAKYTTRIRARSIYDGRNIYVRWTFYSEINTAIQMERVYNSVIIYFFISR